MREIVLKRANVVKQVDSEDRAKALEAKGFVRMEPADAGEQPEAAKKQNRPSNKKNKEELP